MPSAPVCKSKRSVRLRDFLPAGYLSAYSNVLERAESARRQLLLDTAKLIHHMVSKAAAHQATKSGEVTDCMNNDALTRLLASISTPLPTLLCNLNTGLPWLECAADALPGGRDSPDGSGFLELSPDISACVIINVGTHLMRWLSTSVNNNYDDDEHLRFAQRMILLYAASLSLRLPDFKMEIFREHGRTVARKLGKNEAEAKQIILSLARSMLAENPGEYRWKSVKKVGQIRLNHLADSITNQYNAPLRKQARRDRITISSTQKYLRKLIREGVLT